MVNKSNKGSINGKGPSTVVFDDRDEKILEAIRRNPDQDVKKLAEAELLKGIPYPTIAKRVKGLTDAKVLRRIYAVQLVGRKAGFTHRYRIDVIVNPSKLHEPAEEKKTKSGTKKERAAGGSEAEQKKAGDALDRYTSQKELAYYIKNHLTKRVGLAEEVFVEDVHILLGAEPDISVDVYTRENKKILEFVTEGLRKLRGVQATQTAELAWSIKDDQES